MHAMVLTAPGGPLLFQERDDPVPEAGAVRVKIDACGVPWLGHTCAECAYCRSGHEDLRDHRRFTGYTRDGGFATYLVSDARYCFPLGEAGDAVALAPLLCAGLIGWRSLVMAGGGKHLGIYGFGAAGHIIAQVARWQGRSVCAFTRAGDAQAQRLAKSLGVSGPTRRHFRCGQPTRFCPGGDPDKSPAPPC